MISGQFQGRSINKLILSMSIALGVCSNSYAAVSFQSMPLNMVAAPTAVENVGDALSGISGDGSVKPGAAGELVPAVQTGDGSVKPGATGELVPAVQTGDGSVKPGSTSALLPAVKTGGEQAHGGGGGAGKGTEVGAYDSFNTGPGGGEHGLIGLLRDQKSGDKGGDAAHGSGGGGGAGKGTEVGAYDSFHTGPGGGAPVGLNFTKGGDAAHGSGGGGGASKGTEVGAYDSFHTGPGGGAPVGLNFTKGGDAAHGSGGGGGAGKGTEVGAYDSFHTGGAASDIPLDQGGIESSANGPLPQLNPGLTGGPLGTAANSAGNGQLMPTNIQGAALDLPFTAGAIGKQGFADAALAGRGAVAPSFQTQGITGKGTAAGINFAQGAASFAVQQGSLNGAGARAGAMPFNPGALGNFTATPSFGAAAGAASSIGVMGGGAAAAARTGPTGISIGGAGGAQPVGRSISPAVMPGLLLMPQH